MPASHAETVAACIICGGKFTQWNSRNTCCKLECSQERKRRTAERWYLQHRDAHIRAVLKRRKRRKA